MSDRSGRATRASTKDRATGNRRRTLLRAVLSILGIIVAGSGALAVYRIATWPDVASLANRNPSTTAFIDRYRARRAERGEVDNLRWQWTNREYISPNLQSAVLVSEDIEFFHHNGFSRSELTAAIRDAIRQRAAPRGASTITQQLAKNLWLSPSRNPLRKLEEALLTRHLEKHLTKHRILELYLNVAEFGPGIYGAEAAATEYFAKSASRLGKSEAALLAAGLPRPSSWNPSSTSESYKRRAGRIEDLMQYHREFLGRMVGFEY